MPCCNVLAGKQRHQLTFGRLIYLRPAGFADLHVGSIQDYTRAMHENPITVQTTVNAPLQKVWDCWNNPADITGWAFASDDWEAPAAENDLHTGGTFKTTMAAKDKSASFDLIGTYTAVEDRAHIAYDMADGRHVEVRFEETPEGVIITETFDPEHENTEELQRAGWQAILENFKRYAEAK